MFQCGWLTIAWLLLEATYFCRATNVGQSSTKERAVGMIQSNPHLARNQRSAIGCPSSCYCRTPEERILSIGNCTFNPDDIPLHLYPNLALIQIYESPLTTFPCQLENMTLLTHVFLVMNAIESVSCDLSTLTNLIHLEIKGNRLKTMPCSISNLMKLKHLDLSYNEITTVYCNLSNLTHLSYLDLSGNILKTLPCMLSKLTNLVHLDLSYNTIQSAHCELSNLTHLTHLDLSLNNMIEFPCELLSLTQLTTVKLCTVQAGAKSINYDGVIIKLPTSECGQWDPTESPTIDLSTNAIRSVFCDASMLTHVKSLSLAGAGLSTFPCELAGMSKLTALDLSFNTMRSVTCDLSSLNQLTYLKLAVAGLKQFPCEVSSLTKLTSLDISFNGFKMILCNLTGLAHLTSLNLQGILLQTFPCQISSMTQLSSLILSMNSIGSIPCSKPTITERQRFNSSSHVVLPIQCGLSSLRNLTHLDLSLTGMKSIPCGLSSLTQLRSVNFSFNALRSLPCDLTNLPQLTSLDLSVNGIEILPCELSNLSSLAHFYIYDNKLRTFPCELLMHTELTLLDMSSNKIETMICGNSSGHKPLSLEMIVLSHNSISEISMNVLLALQNLSALHLDNNKLKRLPNDITSFNLTNIFELRLGNNPWICDCGALRTRTWMKQYITYIRDHKDVTCQSPEDMVGKNVIFADESLFCTHNQSKYTITGILLGVTIALVCLVFSLRFIRARLAIYKRFKNRLNGVVEDDFEFDVFISYANEDEDYVLDHLVQNLEEQNLKICFHRVHFLGGNTIIDNISQCINNSRRTLVFFTNFYKTSRFCMWEFKEALNKELREGVTCLVTIKDNDLDIHDLDDATKAYFQKHTFIEKDGAKFWESLIYSLPKRQVDVQEIEMEEI